MMSPAADWSSLTPDEMLDLLGETAPEPRQQLQQIALRLGPVAMTALMDAVFTIEAQGGLLTGAGQRRTPGGVLFHLTRAGQRFPRSHPTPAAPPALLSVALETTPPDLRKGVATVKLVLVGRPKETLERDEYVLVQMESHPPQSFPKGLPTPPSTETVWTVLIARKQWSVVVPALRHDKEDKLVVEGQPCQLGAVLVVYATQVITQAQQRAKKEAQRTAVLVTTKGSS
jgi:PHAX RNA-binding domain